MKRITIVGIIFSLILSVFASLNIAVVADVPTANDLNGYENVCLTYTFRTSGSDNGRHYVNDLLPYVGYRDTSGKIKDYFFDSYLFLPCMDFGPSGARMHVDVNNPTKAVDWTAYVEDTFYPGANVDALEKSFGYVKDAMGDKDKKAGVFFTILYPCAKATDFGTLGGKQLNFSKTEDRKYAIKWMIDEQIKLFNEGEYKNLDLVGFYWLEEFIVEERDVELFQYAAEYLHSLDLKFIWIPWYMSSGYNRWEELGFDAVCMQPNLFWMGYYDPNRVQNSVDISNRYGMGMELELDYRVTTDDHFNRYLDYLEVGMDSGMMDGVKMYYQDGKPGIYYQAAFSDDKRFRIVYDLTYKYAKGTLTKEDIDAVRPEIANNYVSDIKFDEILWSDVNWLSVGKSYTGCASYVDGNGMGYQNVDGKELTDGIIADHAVTTDWHAFHNSIRDDDFRMSVVVDLEEVCSLTDFAAHFDNRMDYGIGAPADIKIHISTDGVNYRYLASPNLVMDSTDSCINYKCDPVSARYVKLSFVPADMNFVFCSEFLIGTTVDIDNTSDYISDDKSDEVIDDTNNNDNKNQDDSNTMVIIVSIIVAIAAVVAIVFTVIVKRRK